MPIEFTPSHEVRHTIADGVLTVTVEREAKHNPLSLGVLEAIRGIFTEAAADDSISLAVVTAAGDAAFASGGDLKELDTYRRREDAEALSLHGRGALDAIRRFPVPVIARLNGFALGGGAELALACDQRYAAAHATIGFVHARLAIAPAWGGGGDLVRLLGPARALRLLATGEVLSAQAALAIGLIDLVAPAQEAFDPWFAEVTAPFRSCPRQVARALKALVSRAGGRAESDQLETRHFTEVWAHADHWDAVGRLLRKPAGGAG